MPPKTEHKKKHRRHNDGISRSGVRKVLKQVHKGCGLTKHSMQMIVDSINSVTGMIATEAVHLARVHGKKTVKSADVMSAVRMALPGELAVHAHSEIRKAVEKVGPYKNQQKGSRLEVRAGLQFTAGRARRVLKALSKRVSVGAIVALTAFSEYLAAEVLELAGKAAQDNKFKRIKPRHITLAIRFDDELDALFSKVTFASGGVIPNIHPVLLPKKKGGKKATNEQDL